ncbi:MAG TPA: GNAT family N-acetyltransferase [Candidatus Sulfotelmatobacter sp.]|nr:GNAT family N-acetyltransferase [Candidatus Sulfotelmatobacter sp.]
MNNNPVKHNVAGGQFEITLENQTAILQYRRSGETIRLIHTEVPEPLRRRGLANQLARAALDYAHFNQLKVVPVCPFIKAYLEKHPESAT